jgi:acyl dehydratase
MNEHSRPQAASEAQASGASVPVGARYFEDYVPGSVHDLGFADVTEHAIVEFARRYDPQPFHVDVEAAKRTPFGGLIASGWHTVSLMMRMCVEHYLSQVASLGSPGIDELRWLKPVRPGDRLHVRATVVDAKRSRSKPDRGVVTTAFEVRNQHGEIVMTLRAINLLLSRNAA